MSATSILTDLRIIQREADAAFAERCDTITLRQFMVLDTVSRTEFCSQRHIVEQTAIDRSTVSDIVARLQKHGLLDAVIAETDKRTQQVFLTDKGRAALKAARGAARSVARFAKQSIADAASKMKAA
ncbi:MAG: MarR family transcriptional regulator [Parvibaculum sp.]|nr:MarR family transcriptional regulator [Parvibaculum sp.]